MDEPPSLSLSEVFPLHRALTLFWFISNRISEFHQFSRSEIYSIPTDRDCLEPMDMV